MATPRPIVDQINAWIADFRALWLGSDEQLRQRACRAQMRNTKPAYSRIIVASVRSYGRRGRRPPRRFSNQNGRGEWPSIVLELRGQESPSN